MVLDKLVTCTRGTLSAAPTATFLTVAVKRAALSFGTIMACTPAASAFRKQAPKLCGSVTPSKINKNGACPLPSASARMLSRSASVYAFPGLTRATTP